MFLKYIPHNFNNQDVSELSVKNQRNKNKKRQSCDVIFWDLVARRN